MSFDHRAKELFDKFIQPGDHQGSDYFGLIRELVALKNSEGDGWQHHLDQVYGFLLEEIKTNSQMPQQPVSFGTSGWRGKLGKDIFVKSVGCVTKAIVKMYDQADEDEELSSSLGVTTSQEARRMGCVVGYDNRFGGETLAVHVARVLVENGFKVYFAGESTTGVLSAAVLESGAAFSVNLTPSHNPLEYGGYKFNAADAGPAESRVTERITSNANRIIENDSITQYGDAWTVENLKSQEKVTFLNSLACWKSLVVANEENHGLNMQRAVERFLLRDDMVVAVDSVHGASRLHIEELFDNCKSDRLILLRNSPDVTFGGVAPEPSSTNIAAVHSLLQQREEQLKLGAIIDPDGDRIRFTDGESEISMNQFGAMAYHFMHEKLGKKGMVGKTVATSNLANELAKSFGEEIFEPSVGFKNFKPVIGSALVIFEESDGISTIGHTPEKDAYIGLLLALEMTLATGMNLGEYLRHIESEYGAYYPDRDGVLVPVQGAELMAQLDNLKKYEVGTTVAVGDSALKIKEVITIDGRKMVFEDGSWLMIRPSGTEPKVRFYVEARTAAGCGDLVRAAEKMLQEIGILQG